MKEIIAYTILYVYQLLILAILVDFTISICLYKYRRILNRLSSSKELAFRRILRWEICLTSKILAAMISQTHFHILKDDISKKIRKKNYDIEKLAKKLSECYINYSAFTYIIPTWYHDSDINARSYPLSQSQIAKFLEKLNIPSGIRSVLSVYDYYILNIKEIERAFKIKIEDKKVHEYLINSVTKLYKNKYQPLCIQISLNKKYK